MRDAVMMDSQSNGEAQAENKEVHEESRQIQLRFITKLPANYRIPLSNSIAVPAHLTRHGLSEIINTLLQLDKPQPFDFLIQGEFVRTSLEKFLLSKGISAEKIIDVEYALVVIPPQQEQSSVHDDWVSVVDGSYESFIFTGSYDSIGRIWRTEKFCTHVLHGHKGAITSAAFVSSPDTKHEVVRLATASKDRTILLWQFDVKEDVENAEMVKSCKLLKGHTSAIQTVTASKCGKYVFSGSWDSSIKVWPCSWDTDVENASGVVKKRKLEDNSAIEELMDTEISASKTLEGHTQCVSSVAVFQDDRICSASWDHSVRIWDIESGVNMLTMGCGKALNCLSIGGEASQLIVAAGADPVLRIWDPRMPGNISPILQLSSHKSWISACKWHPKSRYHLLSASFDGTIKLWDTRSKIPLMTVEAHKDKVLCTDWWKEDCIVSGGTDSKMRIFSNLKIT
eukprot:TRINITY_DN25622_c0_g1_i1.p1 TRINITY_DN25622_c0_g1~~TRINITY_DN25622_c0_g1_i1.p1  ORF type:complete len:454 (+),score=82.46 TRINITY_DN25622_c0_g1_i1:67-1428(+)